MPPLEPLAIRTLRANGHNAFAADRRVLFVVCGYREERREALSEKLLHFALPGAVGERDRFLKEFYANPRDAGYIVNALCEFMRVNEVTAAAEFVIDTAWGQYPEPWTTLGDRLSTADLESTTAWSSGALSELEHGRYGTVVLVFADAIGLGCETIVSRILAAPVQSRFLINGRRRAAPLAPPLARALGWRRFLARTRLVERALALGAWPFGAVLAALDGLRGR